jgi:hypothetical protein
VRVMASVTWESRQTGQQEARRLFLEVEYKPVLLRGGGDTSTA